MTTLLRLGFISAILSLSVNAQDTGSFSWSSKTCDACASTILNPGWYSDGSGLFAETFEGKSLNIMATLSLTETNLVVGLGFALPAPGNFKINPYEAVHLESDSSAKMVLYPVTKPDPRIPKKDVTREKQFKEGPVTITTEGAIAAGYLFFPNDPNASNIIIVIESDGHVYRFPFKRDSIARAKFVDPDAVTSTPAPSQSTPASVPQTSTPAAAVVPTSVARQDGEPSASGCTKNISFARTAGGQVESAIPDFAAKWGAKNLKKYPGVCFSQTPLRNAHNYLLVFADSQSAFNGFYPSVRTTTSTDTSPISGSGTLTDNYGGIWQYTFYGTLTTTTTTTVHENLAYTDRERTGYIYCYDEHGSSCGQHWRTVSTRSGGDPYNTLGYNLGALFSSVHVRERLLNDAVKNVAKQP